MSKENIVNQLNNALKKQNPRNVIKILKTVILNNGKDYFKPTLSSKEIDDFVAGRYITVSKIVRILSVLNLKLVLEEKND